MWQLDHKESWAQKNWCFWTVALENPLDFKEIQPVHPKGNQSWVFTERTDAEAETPILWLPDAKSWLIWKDPDAEKDWWQEEKGTTENEMVGWHRQLNGHGFGWTPGVGDGQGGLAYCGFWGHKESDTTEWLNLTELNIVAGGRRHLTEVGFREDENSVYKLIHILRVQLSSFGVKGYWELWNSKNWVWKLAKV